MGRSVTGTVIKMHAWLIFVPVEKRFHPYRDAASILDEWFRARSDAQGLRDKLMVSGLSPALKAEKRADLARDLAAIV